MAARSPGILALLPVLSFAAPVHAVDIRVLLVPETEATLAAEMAGRLVELPVRAGDRVESGQLLAAFDCAIPRARLAKARAERVGAQKTLESNQKLSRLGSFSQLDLDLSESRLREAEASEREAQALVGQCRIPAPFSGRVVSRLVNNHESLTVGQEILELLDDRSLRLELFVPSLWLRWLESGTEFRVSIGETGQDYPARVERIGARVDAVSQSVPVYGRIIGDFPQLMAGMSGDAHFTPPDGGE